MKRLTGLSVKVDSNPGAKTWCLDPIKIQGFLKYVDEDNDDEGSVKEVSERNCLQQPLVRGNNCLYM